MNARTRMLALSAAAKVTLVGAFACEKAPMVTAETAQGPMPTANATAPLPPAEKPEPTTMSASSCGVGGGTNAASAPTLQCCQSAVAAVTAAMRKPSSPDEIACCLAMARANDERMRANGGGAIPEMSDRYPCCEALGWQGTMTCTPWGPPMPPEMDSVA